MAENIAQFTISVEVDEKKLEKGLKKAEQTTKQKTESIAKISQEKLGKMNAAFSKVTANIKKFAMAFAGFSTIKVSFSQYTQFTQDLINSNALLGMNTEELSAMGRAMTRFGGDLSSVTGSLKTMNANMREARFGGGALIEVAKRYGIVINPYQKADKALMSLARAMKNFNLETKVAIMQQLGLDEAMQRALIDGGLELSRMVDKQRLLGVETEEDIKIAKEFQYAWADLRDLFAAISRELMRIVLPILKGIVKVMSEIVDVVRNHKMLLYAFFAGLFLVMSPILVLLGKMAVAAVIAFAPFLKIGAIIAGIAIVFEDLWGYFNGWDSVTGRLVKKYPLLKKVIEPLRPLIQGIAKLFENVINLFKDPSIENFKKIFTDIESSILGFGDLILSALDDFFEYMKKEFPNLSFVFEALQNAFKGLWDLVKGLWLAVKDFFKALLEFNVDGMIQAVKDAFATIWRFIESQWSNLKNLVGGFFDSINPFSSSNKSNNQQVLQPVSLPVPLPPTIVNSGGTKNVNVTNNLNQNFTTNATPQQITNSTNQALIDSVSQQRQFIGGF